MQPLTVDQVGWVFDCIVKNGAVRGSFRNLIYNFMGFGSETYDTLYRAGGMKIANKMYTDDTHTSQLIDDKREIKLVVDDAAQCNMWVVGQEGVTKIECYPEPGQYSYIPFLAIYKGEHVAERGCALNFRLIYAEEAE